MIEKILFKTCACRNVGELQVNYSDDTVLHTTVEEDERCYGHEFNSYRYGRCTCIPNRNDQLWDFINDLTDSPCYFGLVTATVEEDLARDWREWVAPYQSKPVPSFDFYGGTS